MLFHCNSIVTIAQKNKWQRAEAVFPGGRGGVGATIKMETLITKQCIPFETDRMILNKKFVIESDVFVVVVFFSSVAWMFSCFDLSVLLGTLVTLPLTTSHIISICSCVCLALILFFSFTHQFSQTARSLVL